MGKDFLNLKTDQKKLYVIIFCGGILITLGMGMNAYRNSKLQNGYELKKNEVGEGAYEQEVIANVEGFDEIPVTVTVEEQSLTKEEADKVFKQAIPVLENVLKGKNESLAKVTENLNFVDFVPETPVEVEWTSRLLEYFYSDGTLREDVKIKESVELKLSAILSCQKYTKDYETVITLLPRKSALNLELLKLIEKDAVDAVQQEMMTLPKEYNGKLITWKKPMDYTFLYFLFLTIGAMIFLKIGSKRDAQH